MRAGAADASGAFEALLSGLEMGVWGHPDTNWTLVPCGTKPHALAMVMVALTNPRYCFAYPAPQAFGFYQSVAVGRDWTYRINDPSVTG